MRENQSARKTFGERQCVECGKTYEARQSTQRFCSQACAIRNVHSRNRDVGTEERPCEHCGKAFRPRPGNAGRFCSRPCLYAGSKGEKAAHWRGGRHISTDGYVKVYAPDHPSAMGKGGYVLEHRLVMEEKLGRPLTPDETVHHVNGDRSDNRPENLELWSSRHPKGQRVEDLIAFAREIIDLYG